MAGNQIFFNGVEIYNGNNQATDFLWENLNRLICGKSLQNNIELVNFLDSINQDKYGRGFISSHIEKFFKPNSPNLLILYELIEEIASNQKQIEHNNSENVTFYRNLANDVYKTYEGKRFYRANNSILAKFALTIKNSSLIREIKNKDKFNNFLEDIQNKNFANQYYIDFDKYFEAGSSDLLILNNILDICADDIKNNTSYAGSYRNAYLYNITEYQKVISSLYNSTPTG